MGLAKPTLQFIAREHKRKPFRGSVLTLGRQGLNATFDEVCKLMSAEGITPAPLPVGMRTETNIPSWLGTPYEKYTNDVAFFKLLGLDDVQTLDYSDYEHAEVIHDLNQPIPEELRERFDIIIDGGTLEHVFDIRQSLKNIASMLKPGGRVIHISPANNYTNHGFYQISPTLYFDYYACNGFVQLKGYIAEQDTYVYDRRPWEFFEVTPNAGRFTSSRSLMIFFIAEKTKTSTAHVVPTQSFYQRIYQPARGRSLDLSAAVKRMLPDSLKVFLARNVPFLDPMRKPWGLKRWDRLG